MSTIVERPSSSSRQMYRFVIVEFVMPQI